MRTAPSRAPASRTGVGTYALSGVLLVSGGSDTDPRTPPTIVYREKHGPRCIAAADIAGAAVTGPSSVDFGLRGGTRVRARLEDDCPALDYYGGFYVTPQPDGRICADRDAIRTRSGGECGIDRFKALVPAKP